MEKPREEVQVNATLHKNARMGVFKSGDSVMITTIWYGQRESLYLTKEEAKKVAELILACAE